MIAFAFDACVSLASILSEFFENELFVKEA